MAYSNGFWLVSSFSNVSSTMGELQGCNWILGPLIILTTYPRSTGRSIYPLWMWSQALLHFPSLLCVSRWFGTTSWVLPALSHLLTSPWPSSRCEYHLPACRMTTVLWKAMIHRRCGLLNQSKVVNAPICKARKMTPSSSRAMTQVLARVICKFLVI